MWLSHGLCELPEFLATHVYLMCWVVESCVFGPVFFPIIFHTSFLDIGINYLIALNQIFIDIHDRKIVRFNTHCQMAANKPPQSSSIIRAINMRYVSLICLTLQTTSIIILYSYSRAVPKGGKRYLSSTVVALAEVLKLAFCSMVIYRDSG